MIKETTVSAKTIDEAVALISKELGVNSEEITIEVLEQPRKSLLGFKVTPAVVKGTYELKKIDVAPIHLEKLLQKMGASSFSLKTEGDEKGVKITIQGTDLEWLVGKKGETLDAIQYILSLMVNDHSNDYFRITLDCNNYRAAREKELISLAKNLSNVVLKKRKPVTLEPMNPYERRIIHSAIQEVSGVTSSSTGVEPRRCVVIRFSKNK